MFLRRLLPRLRMLRASRGFNTPQKLAFRNAYFYTNGPTQTRNSNSFWRSMTVLAAGTFLAGYAVGKLNGLNHLVQLQRDSGNEPNNNGQDKWKQEKSFQDNLDSPPMDHVRSETQAYNEPYMQHRRIEDAAEKAEEKTGELKTDEEVKSTPESSSTEETHPQDIPQDIPVNTSTEGESEVEAVSVSTTTPAANSAGLVEDIAAEHEDEEAAFDPETGEINWDCPCLGGMAHGPCGEQFKAAFSCFVYSTSEPKGMECLEKFQAMQNCFREHPEMYSDMIADEDATEKDKPHKTETAETTSNSSDAHTTTKEPPKNVSDPSNVSPSSTATKPVSTSSMVSSDDTSSKI
ncbi:TIM22 inner membrane protein import complex subunit Tim40 [Schizosaccharomyces japonicus yFS275]|uniref:Mitochondrial intermembrane space import and assembly protein 40 n=1 Tax=Schizosaccharomyces japonicus (strain yFS275 / FY16936) TaxID=402676 RepID=B6JXQ4_SCHJY|nr:TIM22 inner membrane protein import complex subunit Tim40 [Schizosaccharomyces japonicus yFS275]EEB05198.2 TIM22 inner membrane protein import complex subunit Tim40 [Schizosaccharomyces japonicus yFS275]